MTLESKLSELVKQAVKALYDIDATDAQIYSTLWAKLTELNKTLPSFKKIKALEVRNEEFPKTTSMKIKRHLVQ